MWYQQSEEYRRAVAEEQWDEIRRQTATRRLLRARSGGGGARSLARRAVRYLGQTFSPHPPARALAVEVDEDDAEIRRLLSLLGPDGTVLRVETIDPDEEEVCCSPIA